MEQFVDDWGCIVQGPPHRDGGDGGHRMGGYRLAMEVRKKLGISNTGWWEPDGEYFKFYVVVELQHPNGWIRRHPDDEMWYSGWLQASRDLTLSLMSGVVITGMKKSMRKFIKSHFKNWGYIERIGEKKLPFKIYHWLPMMVSRNQYKNHIKPDEEVSKEEEWKKLRKFPDFTLFETWAMEIRGARAWYLYPFLWIFDLETLIGSLTWNYARDDDTDVNSHLYVTETIQHVYPTLIGWLAHRLLNWKRIKQKYHDYYHAHPEDITEMYFAWEPIFDYYIKRYN
jgi:hypothetical protein